MNDPQTSGPWYALAAFGIIAGANNLAVSLTLGAMGQRERRVRILLVFAGFEFLLPLTGVWLGRHAALVLAGHTAWMGPAVLALLGVATLLSVRKRRRNREKLASSVTSWSGLILLSAGLSVDNLVVGFGLGLDVEGVTPLALATTIMFCSVAFAWLGLHLGHRLRRGYESLGPVVAGWLLIALAWASFADWI